MSESQWNTEPLKGSQVSIKQNALKVYKMRTNLISMKIRSMNINILVIEKNLG